MTPVGQRILIVEDQRLIAADIEHTLRKLGYEIAGSVATGEEAVTRALGLRPNLILMDIRLRGEMDGIQAAAAIRAQLDVAIVYLTANADDETILRAKQTAPFGYILKPFNERELRAAIEVALSKHETDRLLLEERAGRQAAEEFKLLVDSVHDYAIYMLDPAGRVTTWNEGARRIKGYTNEEIVGKHFSVFYPPAEAAAGLPDALLDAALRQGRAETEGWRIRKDGSRFWAGVAISPMRDEAGRLHGFGKVTRDLSERKRSEEQREQLITELKRAVHLREDFLSVASHELRTPLTALGLQLELMQSRLAEEGGWDGIRDARSLKTAIRQSDRLTTLVETLLDVRSLASRELRLRFEPFDLRDLVAEIIMRLAELASKEACELRLQGDSRVVGTWDRARLDQVLTNLLSNAIKYGPGNPIDVRLEATPERVEIAVQDRGIGIALADQERVFDRFERAVPSSHYGGLGLGLYVAREVIEAHGGEIEVRSLPQQGATFVVRLPRVARQPPAGADPSAQRRPH